LTHKVLYNKIRQLFTKIKASYPRRQ